MDDVLRSSGLLVSARGGHPGALGADELRRAAAQGLLLRLRAGAYVGVDHWEGLDSGRRHLLEVRAALVAQPRALVSHRSALAVLGLPLVGVRGDAVHLTVRPTGGGRSTAAVRRHQASEVVEERVVRGIRVTGPARTLVDVACDDGLLTAVAAGDEALRTGLVSLAELEAELVCREGRRGVRVGAVPWG